MTQPGSKSTDRVEAVAIIGMAGRFPGAPSVEAFWQNQLRGLEAISHFSVEELEIPDAAHTAQLPNYVRSRSVLENIDLFDAEFFQILPKEAELIDPQQRIFLEICWEALETAGYNSLKYPGSIGVYAGCAYSSYLLSTIARDPAFIDRYLGGYQTANYPVTMGNHPDFLATRVSYKLNLRGPSYTMVAGCSTSLLAVAEACQSLQSGQNDMMLAGAVSITLPQKRGHLFQEGGIGSADGKNRSFDEQAAGTVFGSGAGVVLLKRLPDALRDGDTIHAVIRGFAVNNDGAAKVGYTAPSIEGQTRVIQQALRVAGVDPATIGYVEAHGTATPLGDPIELAALRLALGSSMMQNHASCVVGTAKTNVGHLDLAAGVTGLIHATHIVREGKLPPTLHFTRGNPNFPWHNSPFHVNTQLTDWNESEHPRRAGVSAFGIGGTNAHVILEQPPPVAPGNESPRSQLLLLSARTSSALDAMSANLAQHLEQHPETNLADAAYTLQVGRRSFPHRRYVIASSTADAASLLRRADSASSRPSTAAKQDVCFLFPGQGVQYPGMGLQLAQAEPVFGDAFSRCAALLEKPLHGNLIAMLEAQGDSAAARERLAQTEIAQPLIFAMEYSLAQLWMSWGIQPRAMIGHSVGEFTAACLAKVFSLEAALEMVALRGKLMQSMAPGAMTAVPLSEDEARKWLDDQISIAAINGPELCVLAGPTARIEALEAELQAKGIASRRLHTSHAFHSAMMEDAVAPFVEAMSRVERNAPQMAYLSSLTGDWIRAGEAQDPAYWGEHLRAPVQFSAGIQKLRATPGTTLLEVGPGAVLSNLARHHAGAGQGQLILSSLRDHGEVEVSSMLDALGQLWLRGAEPAWEAHHASVRQRIPLPTYPFERRRLWLEAPAPPQPAAETHTEVSLPDPDPKQVSVPNLPIHPVVEEKKIMSSDESVTQNQQLRRDLAAIVEDLSGLAVNESQWSASFLDLGFDSLFLTQIAQAVQKRYGTKITFRQLLDTEGSLNALGTYLEAHAAATSLPSHAAQPPEPPAAAVTAPQTTAPLAAPSSTLEQLMRDQMQTLQALFAQQLAALSHGDAAARTMLPATAQERSAPAVQSPQGEVKELKGYSPFKPLQKTADPELTPVQQAHIASLIRRYAEKTAGSKRLTQQQRRFHADPRVVAGFKRQWKELIYPIITNRSQGAYLWDIDGNQYIDILNGFGPIMLGHRPPYVQQAIEEQLQRGFEIGPQTALAGEVAAMICEMTGNERATFCNTGSEAVTAAFRVARTVTGRDKVVVFAGDYHGMFDEVLVKGFLRNGEPRSMPASPGIPHEKTANIVVLEYGASESLEWIRKHATELAAVMVEPVQSRHPNLQPVEFLRQLREITAAADTCFIFDEVVTGFRTHLGGCQALFGIRADLATYGKVLAGGMPIGVLAGSAKYMDALDGGMWEFGDDSYPETGVTFFAGTFVRHPLTMAACHAVLHHLKESGPALQENLSRRTADMTRRINELFERNSVPATIENFASICYLSFSPQARFGSLFYSHLRLRGIHLLEGFPCFLTTEHSKADVERIVQAFADSIAEMQAGELLPAPVATAPSAAFEFPLTEAQREIWLSAQISEQASCAFNESFTLQLGGDLCVATFCDCVQRLVERHESLRSCLSPTGATMICQPHVRIEIPFVDLSNLDAVERESRIAALHAAEAATAFDLESAPLLRVHLVKQGERSYAAVFTAHHIVCDGWSVNVILEELSRLYAGETLDAPLRFSEYARQQRAAAQNTEAEEVASYWKDQFADSVPVLDLPTDRPRPAIKSYAGATYRTHIDAATIRQIRNAGASQGCTLFVTLLTGFSVLMARLANQSDVVVGIPTAAQSQLEDGAMVGHAVNFLPIRTRIGESEPLGAILGATKRNLLHAYEHQNYTYGTLIRNLQIRKDPSRLPLMEVQFNLERVGSALQFPGMEISVLPNPKAAVNFDLFLNAVEGPDGLTLDCDYNTDLFDRNTIERWLRHYEYLLRNLEQNLSQPYATVPLFDFSEQTLPTGLAMEVAAQYASVAQLIEEQSRRTPEQIAVDDGQTQLSYFELNRKANQFANYLIDLGVRPGDLVGIAMQRGVDLVVSLLGAWKAGAAYVPIDPNYPRERIQYILDKTSVPILITQTSLLPHLPAMHTQVVCVDRDWALVEQHGPARPYIPPDSKRLAYVIFTSGSTGNPKGVEVTQANLLNFFLSMQQAPGMQPSDRLLALTTLSFDIAGLELYLPLTVGARLIVASRETAGDPRLLRVALKDHAITVLQATPATWRMLIEAGWEGTPKLKMLCGGEALPYGLAQQLLARGAELWNMYGPTETTIWSSIQRVQAGKEISLGEPIANTQLYILSTERQPQPFGTPGELYIGGAGVAKGYLKQSDLTAERFLPDPFAQHSEARMYRTGDKVRRRSDGSIEFLGRMDYQVKIRGFRIELGEIETALAKHSAIRNSVVAAREDIPGDKRLVAYLVCDPAQMPAIPDLRNWLGHSLPEYMIPSLFVFLPSLPMTPNGKVDRKQLPAPEDLRRRPAPANLSPQTETERQLAQMVAEVLHLDAVDVDDSLFDLGADSLHMFQLIARAQTEGILLKPEQVLRLKTIRAIAAAAQENRTGERLLIPAAAPPTIKPVARDKYRVTVADLNLSHGKSHSH
jgi:amino acid adenylation domain-containing protein